MQKHVRTKYLEFKSAISPMGSDWYYVKRTNDSKLHDSAVVITTVVKSDSGYNFLFLKTRRPPMYNEKKSEYCIESPAGLIGDNDIKEMTIECAKKELLEEAGLIADKLFLELTNSPTSAGLSSETLSFVTAICNDYKIHQTPVSDDGIIVDRILVDINKVDDFILKNNLKDTSIATSTIAGIYLAKIRFKNIEA